MTRKDFELIAAVFADNKPAFKPPIDYVGQAVLDEHAYLANAMAAKLRSTNPRFDRERFLAACGVSQPA